MTLEEFMAAEAAEPFAWARFDCTMMCDRWVRLRRGVSPVEAGPIRYSDEASAMRILPRLPMLMNRAMRKAGLEPTREPRKGDVGLVAHAGRAGPAIHSGACWITRHRGGFWTAPAAGFLKAWSI